MSSPSSDNDTVRSGAGGGRVWWLVAAGLVAVSAVATLAVLVRYSTRLGVAPSEQWANILTLPLAWLGAATSVVVWMLRRARRAAEARDPVVPRLRRAV